MKNIIKIAIVISICISTSNAGLVGKAWDESVSSTLKDGCLDLTGKKEKPLGKAFITIIFGMGTKVVMKEANLSEKDMNNNEQLKNLITKIVVKGCKGGLFLNKDVRLKKFNFTEKVRGAMELYVREILNKKKYLN